MLFEPVVEQIVSGGVFEPSEAQTEPEGILESCVVQTGSEGVLKSSGVLSESEDSPGPVSEGVCVVDMEQSGPKHSSEASEAQTGHAPVFLKRLDDPFINLDPIRDLEEGDSPRFDTSIEIIQPKLIQILKPSEGQPKRRFKTFASRTNLQLVRKLRALHSGPSSAPSKSITTPTPASTKSAKKSSTCTHKSPKHARPSE